MDVPVEYAVAVDRYLSQAALGGASRRVYRISLAGWAWPLAGKPIPGGRARRRAVPPVVPLARPLAPQQVTELFRRPASLREHALWRLRHDSGASATDVLALDADALDLTRNRTRPRPSGQPGGGPGWREPTKPGIARVTDYASAGFGRAGLLVTVPGMQVKSTHIAAQDWRQRAACRHADPELFFPISAAGPGRGQVAEAKAVCARCPVRPDCLSFALSTRQAHGIWGGLSEQERYSLTGHRWR
jgi:WhiB family transcriptional regulator, redox-sensing transcriptional regulator